MLALRLALWGGERTLAQALIELALWLGGLALATRRLEGGLLAELRGYLRAGARGVRPSPLLVARGRASISGFTLRRYLGPLDEGILMQAATRMAGRRVAVARLRLGLRARASRWS